MDEKQEKNEMDQWFSTYGFITAQRILERYQIFLPSNELMAAIKKPTSFYHYLLQIPIKNIFNGIIFDQAHDYHVYAQKKFIDYTLSSSPAPADSESEGATTSPVEEELEQAQQRCVMLGESLNKHILEHQSLIASSQMQLIKLVKQWKSVFESSLKQVSITLKQANLDAPHSAIREGMNHALIFADLVKTKDHQVFVNLLDQNMSLSFTEELKASLMDDLRSLLEISLELNKLFDEFLRPIHEMNAVARSCRAQFYDFIVTSNELLNVTSTFRVDTERDAINKESLYFDNTLESLSDLNEDTE